MIKAIDVQRGRYHDSVRLMQLSSAALDVPGVERALVAMATDLNLASLQAMGFDVVPLAGLTADDLLVAIEAVDQDALSRARRSIEEALANGGGVVREGVFQPPETHLIGSTGRTIGATVALISVPGPYAFVEAMDALRSGMHVMVFSDNVPVESEVTLKRFGRDRNLLVMGPDCGTAIVSGVGLGFANAVRPGDIGICGASGTGIQELCALFDSAGVGVRHALGTGSRDLSEDVGGISTLQAIDALDADPGVEMIVVVSKPPAPSVAASVREAVEGCRTPARVAFLGEPSSSLEGVVTDCVSLMGRQALEPPRWLPDDEPTRRSGWLRGSFAGGTLRDEALAIVSARLGPVAAEADAAGHRLVDFGGDEFTRGRPHPMIDQRLRVDRLTADAEDPDTAVVLLDLVLGYGAHPDPAPELLPALEIAHRRRVPVVVSLCGTAGDPQDRERQARLLKGAGAAVFVSNAAAARHALDLVAQDEEVE